MNKRSNLIRLLSVSNSVQKCNDEKVRKQEKLNVTEKNSFLKFIGFGTK